MNLDYVRCIEDNLRREVELVASVITFNTNFRKLTGETNIMQAYDIETKINRTASGLKDQKVFMV